MENKLFLLTVIVWLASPTHSAVIECTWDPQMQICSPFNITPITQQNEVITIGGRSSDYVNTFTKYIGFFNKVINYMPSGLLTLFPGLQNLNIGQCEIKLLTSNSIPNCASLRDLVINGGVFTAIPAEVVKSCSSLMSLYFTDGNVTTVDENAFKGLASLQMLHLSNNKISCLPLRVFQNTPSLVQIILSDNLITSIDSNHFTNIPTLNTVFLERNMITSIPMMNFTGNTCPALTLYLTHNPINAITPDFCSVFGQRSTDIINFAFQNASCISKLGYFTVSSSSCQNSLTDLQNCYTNWTPSMNASVTCPVQPPTTLAPTTAVVTTPSPTPGSCPSDRICRYFLDQYNRYTCILDGVDSVLTSISGNHLITFGDLNVRRVIFTNSFLSRIPPILFQKFTSLEYLTVANCSMSAINTNTFSACGNLKYFDASDNFITTVNGASFKSCASLEVIDLTGNKFDMISGQLFVNNPALKAVYINRPPAMVLI